MDLRGYFHPRLLPSEARGLALIAWAATCIYGALIAVCGIALAAHAAIDPDNYGDLGVWMSPLAAIATAVAVAAVVRAVPALWRTVRGNNVRESFTRFASSAGDGGSGASDAAASRQSGSVAWATSRRAGRPGRGR